MIVIVIMNLKYAAYTKLEHRCITILIILNLVFIRYWNQKLSKNVIIQIVSIIRQKPVLIYQCFH